MGLMMVDTSRAGRVAKHLIELRQTLAVTESSAGGLISAALLSVPGASAYFLGGGVIYTGGAREALLGITPAMLGDIRSSTEAMARLQAETVRTRLGADWALTETGAAGPSGNRYGDAAGHNCLAVAGPRGMVRTIETGAIDRMANMAAFADAALALLEEALSAA